MTKKLLEGLKVADFTLYVAGPQITKVLAAYGAEVIRIEGKSKIDFQRVSPPFKDMEPGFNRGGDFNQYNTSKLSMAVNLAKPKGVELAKRLVAWADLVIENFSGGAMTRMGLGYEELKRIKADIIMLSTCMQGQTGPYATSPGTGYHLTALSGFYHITGWPDREPVGPDGPYPDYIAPRLSLLALLAALDYRRRTGKGQYIDISQYETAVHFMTPLVLDDAVNQRVAGCKGNRCDYAAPHGVYRCRGDGKWCAIAAFTDEEWESFGKVTGNQPWAKDTRFATLPARKKNEDELDCLVEEWTVNLSPLEVMNMMQAAGVGAGVVQTAEDLLEHDPQLKHNHLFWELDHPEIGKYRAPGSSFVLSKSPYVLQRAPLLGEHNEYVLKQVLGLPDEEIAELVVEGVIE